MTPRDERLDPNDVLRDGTFDALVIVIAMAT